MLKKTLIFSIILNVIFVCHPSYALDWSKFLHVPPEPQIGDKMMLVASGVGIQDIRALVLSKDGYRIVQLNKEGETFQGKILFAGLSILRYQFQIRETNGEVSESQFYELNQPSNTDLDLKISKLRDNLEDVEARKIQFQNAVLSLRSTDPRILGKKKNQERARAYITLTKKERERDALLNKLEKRGSK